MHFYAYQNFPTFHFTELRLYPNVPGSYFLFSVLIVSAMKVLSKTLVCLPGSWYPSWSPSQSPLLEGCVSAPQQPIPVQNLLWSEYPLPNFLLELLLCGSPLLTLNLYFLILAFACLPSGLAKPFGHSTIWLLPSEQTYCWVSFLR